MSGEGAMRWGRVKALNEVNGTRFIYIYVNGHRGGTKRCFAVDAVHGQTWNIQVTGDVITYGPNAIGDFDGWDAKMRSRQRELLETP